MRWVIYSNNLKRYLCGMAAGWNVQLTQNPTDAVCFPTKKAAIVYLHAALKTDVAREAFEVKKIQGSHAGATKCPTDLATPKRESHSSTSDSAPTVSQVTKVVTR